MRLTLPTGVNVVEFKGQGHLWGVEGRFGPMDAFEVQVSLEKMVLDCSTGLVVQLRGKSEMQQVQRVGGSWVEVFEAL